MKKCVLCPRNCQVDRRNGKTGYCGQTSDMRIALMGLHHWEEPCISGTAGSGAVFFAGCNLGCVYCQNYQISHAPAGKVYSVSELAEGMIELQASGANNINLVTAFMFVPQIIEAIDIARSRGLTIPIVYNSSGYETVDTIRSLKGYVDIFLPDLKYVSAERAEKYSNAKDYFQYASAAIEQMYLQAGEAQFYQKAGQELIKSGVIVRHLVMPGATAESKKVIEYLSEKYGDSIYISIMSQYTPVASQLTEYPELSRRITKREYNKVVDYAIELGINNAFVQDREVAMESFIPDF